jgi:hypothetical protein
MDIFSLALLAAIAAWFYRQREQRQRVVLLARTLGQFQIEKHMETLTQGYLRALGEADAQRRDQVFSLLQQTEQALDAEFSRFVIDFARLDEAATRVSKLPVYLPGATRWLSPLTFDLRKLLAVHAAGIRRAVQAAGQQPARERAFTLSAELFLMQHSCHWFCRSRTIASARLLARHQTPHAQVLASVSPETRNAYAALVA